MAEMIDTGLSEEPAVRAMINIRKYSNTGALFIPDRAVSTVTLAQTTAAPLSDPVIYDDVSLRSVSRNKVDKNLALSLNKAGIPDCVIIKTTLYYPDGSKTGEFQELCERKIRKINYPNGAQKLESGATLKVNISYAYGGYLKSLTALQ